MKKQRKQYAPEEKVAILRRHLLEKEPISKLCDEVGLAWWYCVHNEAHGLQGGLIASRRVLCGGADSGKRCGDPQLFSLGHRPAGRSICFGRCKGFLHESIQRRQEFNKCRREFNKCRREGRFRSALGEGTVLCGHRAQGGY